MNYTYQILNIIFVFMLCSSFQKSQQFEEEKSEPKKKQWTVNRRQVTGERAQQQQMPQLEVKFDEEPTVRQRKMAEPSAAGGRRRAFQSDISTLEDLETFDDLGTKIQSQRGNKLEKQKRIKRPTHKAETSDRPKRLEKSNDLIGAIYNALTYIGKELIKRQQSEDYVFGQYLANVLKNMTKPELKQSLKNELLEAVIKHQNDDLIVRKELRVNDKLKNLPVTATLVKQNDTEEIWPDFGAFS